MAIESGSSDDDYLKWICGYANAEGGTLYMVAKAGDGTLLGMKNTDTLADNLRDLVRDLLGIEVNIQPGSGADGEFLQIEVASQPVPVSYRGEYYFRQGDSRWTLQDEELDGFLLKKQGLHWDSVPLPELTEGELSEELLQGFAERAQHCGRLAETSWRQSRHELLQQLRLFSGPHLKRAAALLFHPDPESIVPGAAIKIGQFADDGRLLRQDLLTGGLIGQVEAAFGMLRDSYLGAEVRFDGLQRIETPPLPEEALRESIANAVVHKDYSVGSPIQIRVYPDRLMLWNPCRQPADWVTVTGDAQHPSRPANPELARVFFQAGLIESWGSGLGRIRQACEAAHCAEPKHREDGGGVWLELDFAPRAEAPPSAPAKAPARTGRPPTAKAQQIMDILRADPTASRRQIADRIEGLSTEGVRYHLDKLRRAGRIAHRGPPNGGHWDVL